MEISGCIGVRLQQTHPEVHRQVFDQPGGGIEERCLEIRQCLVNGGQQRFSMRFLAWGSCSRSFTSARNGPQSCSAIVSSHMCSPTSHEVTGDVHRFSVLNTTYCSTT